MKTKQSITPGPWLADSEHENLVVSESGVLVADCYADIPLDYGLPGVSEYMANAKAIAALPDLIAALKEQYDNLDFWIGAESLSISQDVKDDMAESRAKVKAVLAKAGV